MAESKKPILNRVGDKFSNNMKELNMPKKLVDMSCYQFALYGGLDTKVLRSIGTKFNDFGNAMTTGDVTNLDHVSNVQVADVYNYDGTEMYDKIIGLMAKEFELETTDKRGPVAYLYGSFTAGNAGAPDHVWITYGKDIYDTYPEQSIKTQSNNQGLNPPNYELKHGAADNNLVGRIGLKTLTNEQFILLESTNWQTVV